MFDCLFVPSHTCGGVCVCQCYHIHTAAPRVSHFSLSVSAWRCFVSFRFVLFCCVVFAAGAGAGAGASTTTRGFRFGATREEREWEWECCCCGVRDSTPGTYSTRARVCVCVCVCVCVHQWATRRDGGGASEARGAKRDRRDGRDGASPCSVVRGVSVGVRGGGLGGACVCDAGDSAGTEPGGWRGCVVEGGFACVRFSAA